MPDPTKRRGDPRVVPVSAGTRIERRGRWTVESAQRAFIEAHAKWKSQPEEEGGSFNLKWLENNEYAGLRAWLDRNMKGRILSFVEQINLDEIRDDFSYLERWNLKSAQRAFIEAHAKWKAQPKEERGVFNLTWLQNNGYLGLISWIANKIDGGISLFVEQINLDEIRDDFSYVKRSELWTIESVQRAFIEAHAKWKAQPKEERGSFTATWLVNNGYLGLYKWINKRIEGGIRSLVDQLGSDEVSEDFIYTEGMVLSRAKKAFIEAHAKWKSQPKEERGVFNSRWLENNGYDSLLSWISRKIEGGIRSLVDQVGSDEISDDFSYVETWTIESAQRAFIEAHAKWKAQPKEERGSFNLKWLENNEYTGLLAWLRRNMKGKILSFVEQLNSDEISDDFSYVETWTIESAQRAFIEAHAKWKAQPKEERGVFNLTWLQNNGYTGLRAWLERNMKGKILSFVEQLNSDEISDDFSYKESFDPWTIESAQRAFIEVHAKWKAQPKEERGVFNLAWLRNNGYSGLCLWIRENKEITGVISSFINSIGIDEITRDFNHPSIELERQREIQKTRNEVREFAAEVAEGQTLDAKTFQRLIGFCGASQALDVLFAYRPKFKGLPPDYVRGVLADYLGDTISIDRDFKFEDFDEGTAALLKHVELKKGLMATLKRHCLSFYNRKRLEGSMKSDKDLIDEYLDHAVEALGDIDNDDLADVIEDVVIYFQEIFELKTPDKMRTSLVPGREFPDVNQRINMMELRDKQRILIADEMGTGKSASVIFAKETLKMGTAVMVVPSNVVETWKKYLSDNAEEGGYFEPGKAPRVLVVENKQQLSEADFADYDYVLISHERMPEKNGYGQILEEREIDMLVVDEVHKFKNIKGTRSRQLTRLSDKVNGEGKYVALLSGTPVPNTVRDIAITLKMLYPEQFGQASSKSLVRQIVKGDMIQLRSLLVPRMQMKSLEESVPMPELTEKLVEFELSEIEQDTYEALLEEDELTAMEKMAVLRQFILNPEMVDPTPGMRGAKIEAAGELLGDIFERHNKVVMFVNGYIDGVITGERSIIGQMNLPENVKVRVIYGDVITEERNKLQRELAETDEKFLLIVSGGTADVGVDYSAADEVVFYNEPWTEADRLQQRARVYRFGLDHDLTVHTLIGANTIEEGIHNHILAKHYVVQKLLKGVPLTELEQRMLVQTDQEGKLPDLEVSPELARYYFSAFARMMQIFRHTKQMGEERFKTFLQEYGRHYAQGYVDLGSRSYQANANRVSGSLIKKFSQESGRSPEGVRVLDIASGPEMLKAHFHEDMQDRVISIDLNKEHFVEPGGKKALGSFLQLPFRDESFDYANFTLAWHYTRYYHTKGEIDRIQSLQELNRVLTEGGRVVINNIYSLDLKNPEQFKKAMEVFGFRVVEEYTGEARGGPSYHSRVIVLEKISSVGGSSEEALEKLKEAGLADGLKFKGAGGKVKNQRKVATGFNLNGQNLEIELNQQDQEILAEEREITALGNTLIDKYKAVELIPEQEVIDNGFIRVCTNLFASKRKNQRKKYVLFKKLEKGPGAVVVR